MIQIYRRAAVCAVLGAAAASSPVMAQEARKLDFGLHAGVEHQTNVTRTTKAQSALRGLTPADTLFTPSASIDAVMPVGRQTVFLSGSAGYTFYDKNEKLDRERFNLNGGIRGRFGPCAPTLRTSYMRGVSQYDDPTLIDDARNVLESTSVGLDVACVRETGLGLVGGVSKDWNDNSLSVSKLANSERTSMNLGVSYTRPTLGTITLFANHDKTEYPKRPIEDGYDLDAVGLSYARQLGARIQGTVSVSYNRIDPHAVISGGKQNTTGYSADLSYRASSRLRFMAMFSRSVTPSTAIGRAYDLTDAYRISADYDLGSRIKINLGLAKVERESEGILGLPIIQLTDSSTTAMSGAVRYQQSERLSFSLNAAREERNTNAPQFDYTNDRIGLSADVAF